MIDISCDIKCNFNIFCTYLIDSHSFYKLFVFQEVEISSELQDTAEPSEWVSDVCLNAFSKKYINPFHTGSLQGTTLSEYFYS